MKTTLTTPNFRAMDIAELEQTNGGGIIDAIVDAVVDKIKKEIRDFLTPKY